MRSNDQEKSAELARFIKDRVLQEGTVGKHTPSEVAIALLNMLSAWLEAEQDEDLLMRKIQAERETLGVELADKAVAIIQEITVEASRLGLDPEDKATNWMPVTVDQLSSLMNQESKRELS